MQTSSSSFPDKSAASTITTTPSTIFNSSGAEAIGRMIFFGESKGNENETNGVFAVTVSSVEEEINPSSTSAVGPNIFSNFFSPTAMAATLGESIVSGGGSGVLDINHNVNDSVNVVSDFGESFSNDTMSYWPVRDPLYITVPITVIYVIILILGLLGNVVTCIVIIRSRYLHTTTNYYLFSLAVSDLLLLLSGLPAEMHSIWRRYPYVFGEAFCVGRGLAAETSSNATVLTITAFTIERYLAICRPFMIQKWQNKLVRVVRQILVIWAISIALAIPQALQFGLDTVNVGPNKTAVICAVKTVVLEHSFEIATFVFFICPMILIAALYCLIGFTLRNANRVKESKLRLRKSLSGHKREPGQQRVLKMLVAVVVAFFVCWFPFHLQRLIAIWGTKYLDHSEVLRTTYHILTYISGILYYFSTCTNPILYSVMSLKFRHAFQENVNKCCGEQAQKKPRSEILIMINQRSERSISHSSRSHTQNMVLTEVTTLSNLNGNLNGNQNGNLNGFIHPIHHHQLHTVHLPITSNVFLKHDVGLRGGEDIAEV